MLITLMEATKQPTNSNDYAVAHALNDCVLGFILMIVMADIVGEPEGNEFHDLNRAYVLVVDELEKLYNRNAELAAIKPEPIWKRFDVLKTSSWEINEFLEDTDNDMGQAHNARVEKLSIIAGVEEPDFTFEQKNLLDYAESIRTKYGKSLDGLSKEWRAKKSNNWQIPEYTLTYKPDGSILINDVLKLKKAHAGSITERLLEQAQKNPNTLFKPDLGQTSRNISTVLNSAGFTSTLRQLFFPTVSKSKGIVFRPTITRGQADADNINTTELDLILKELGAITEPKSTK
jgi:hypothetical protein